MGRPIKYQCGTKQAYQRHIKRGENPCAKCITAKHGRIDERKAETEYITDELGEWQEQDDMFIKIGPILDEDNALIELADLRENYKLVREKMLTSGARDLAPLSKRREELMDRIVEIQEAMAAEGQEVVEEKMSIVDEMAARRRARLDRGA